MLDAQDDSYTATSGVRSMILPSRHMVARGLPLLTGELPTAVPRAFTAYAALALPVCVPRSVMPYDCGAAARDQALESVKTRMTATMTPTGGRSRRPRTLAMSVPP